VFFAYSLLITTAVVTGVWLLVTSLTPPTDTATLVAFYRRTRPGLAGWRPIAALAPDAVPDARPGVALWQWALGVAAVYFTLFGVGQILFGPTGLGALMLCGGLLCAWGILRTLAAEPDATRA
jgi:hypothetical protein